MLRAGILIVLITVMVVSGAASSLLSAEELGERSPDRLTAAPTDPPKGKYKLKFEWGTDPHEDECEIGDDGELLEYTGEVDWTHAGVGTHTKTWDPPGITRQVTFYDDGTFIELLIYPVPPGGYHMCGGSYSPK